MFDRQNYFDPRDTTNIRVLGITYIDDDILQFVRNIYAVLLTRGVLGTYIYVCNPHLRQYVRRFLWSSSSRQLGEPDFRHADLR